MKNTLSSLLIGSIALISLPALAGNHSEGEIYSVMSVASSVGSSALVSGILLSPIALPVILVQISVEKSNKPDEKMIKAKTEKGEDVEIIVPADVLEKNPIKPDDKLTLEPVEKGAGAYLKKGDTIISHIVTQDDSSLSHQEKLN
ncbi:putative inner membrane protein [Proteus hauseri ATCC 700826]|uniref:Inner membrane protein n=1 Tax=Proteus hauseri ATCC 700826 TaxID=1354271 RepID=A0AAJ3HR32_PROHU|nr:STM0539 family protein [Proteus hauseri]OAT45771.1 putative inner membrane protein [Proteus hauseri ATCC 700826]